jgi:cell division protein FtsB
MSKQVKYAIGFAIIAVYGWIALRGPLGIQSLLDRRQEIRTLQEKNAAMAREVERRRDRIRRLTESTSEQDMEIRKQLKLLKPGETSFILPEAPSADDSKQ